MIDALLDACDAKDGVKDGMIFNRAGCHFDPAALACKGSKTDRCLGAAQVEALESFGGPKTSHGDQVYPGFPWDVGMSESKGIPGLLHGPTIPVPVAIPAGFDVDRQYYRVTTEANGRLGDSTWTNLSGFAAHGGKLIFYHGVSDPWFSALDTVGYYDKLVRDTPTHGPLNTWSRLFLAPGMGHCGGGSAALDQFDLLGAVVDWVEKGRAPDAVIATGKAFPGRSRPLCAYPGHAEYKGSGDPNEAANFACRE